MARPKQYEEDRVATAVRLPATLHRELQAVAAERDVSVNLLIVKAVSRYLDGLQPIDEPVAAKVG